MSDDIKALKEALEAMLRSASMHAGDWESREGDVNEWGAQCYEVDGERVQELATAYGSTTAAYIAACSPARIARLLERLEAAERDAERLDWIEANVCDVARLADKRLRISWWNGVGQVFVGEGHHKDWRSAIDAAMKKEPQQ
jgi:hypothetical protein